MTYDALMRTCAMCPNSLLSTHHAAKYCSPKCKYRAKDLAKGLTCHRCGGGIRFGKNALPQGEAECQACRTRCGTVGGYLKGCRCPLCTNSKRLAHAEYVAGRTARDGVDPSTQSRRVKRGVHRFATVDCWICKEPLNRVRGNHGKRPLHKACKAKASRWVLDGEESPKVKKVRARIAKAAAGTRGKTVFVQGACAWCGNSFTAKGEGSKWCRPQCRKAAKWVGLYPTAFKVSPVYRKFIYNRDGWVCQLCGNPVDPALSSPHQGSATLDHIVPQSTSAEPDHSEENLRLAHRWCNSARGDGSNMEIEELLARAIDSIR